MQLRTTISLISGLAALLGAVGCSSEDDASKAPDAGTGTPEITLSGGTVRSGDGATFYPLEDGTCGLSIGEDVCVGQRFENQDLPLDLHVMFDTSGSMCSCIDPPLIGGICPDPSCGKTRIEAVVEALTAFVTDPSSAGIGLGLGAFGQQPIGSADCRVSTYATPSVAITTLPEGATAILEALSAMTPIGETPTGAAIRGACNYAEARQAAQPDHRVAILLLTDGEPKAPVSCPTGTEACCPSVEDAAVAAEECAAGTSGIPTYVLGVGPYLQNLDRIAAAGGSGAAYLVEGTDVTADVLAALNRIRSDASIPCSFPLPAPEGEVEVDPFKVNLAFTDSTCNGKVFPYVNDVSLCDTSGGWYYDDVSQPSTVTLCASSCSEVAAPGGQLYYSVGCATTVVIK